MQETILLLLEPRDGLPILRMFWWILSGYPNRIAGLLVLSHFHYGSDFIGPLDRLTALAFNRCQCAYSSPNRIAKKLLFHIGYNPKAWLAYHSQIMVEI